MLQPQDYYAYWDDIYPMLDKVAKDFPGHDLRTILSALLDIDVRFYTFAVWNNDGDMVALIGFELLERAIGDREFRINFVTGRSVGHWIKEVEEPILDMARGWGCVHATGIFRKAFKRHLSDWKHTHDYLERPL